jgi:hypothetical protein
MFHNRKFSSSNKSAGKSQRWKNSGDRITTVSGNNSIDLPTGFTSTPLTANSSALFGSRVAAMALLYQDYRIVSLSFEVLPITGIHGLAVEMEFPETVALTTLKQMSQLSHYEMLNGACYVKGHLNINRSGCLRFAANRWFKTNNSADIAESYQGVLCQYNSGANLADAEIVHYTIEFCNPIVSGLGLSSAIASSYVAVEQQPTNVVAASDSNVVSLAPLPTSRFGFLRK